MNKVFRGIGIVGRVLFIGVLWAVHIVTGLIGLLICAITSEG